MGSERKNAIVSFRIPEWLKFEMENINTNWSEYLRSKIEEKVRQEKIKSIWSEIDEIRTLLGR
ncbi:hypothetical protein [Archaeoglobus neptunius]|uniref:hypothetical protein n=1 Tax=Archaeoglobus neptunius TaxID=2798580 RepID=UPI0019295B3F|nr:hypothetical protein [Archaeoglobus neptunius]